MKIPDHVVEITEAATRQALGHQNALRRAGLLDGDGAAAARRCLLELLAGREVKWSEDRGVVRIRSRRTQLDVQVRLVREGVRLVVVSFEVRDYL